MDGVAFLLALYVSKMEGSAAYNNFTCANKQISSVWKDVRIFHIKPYLWTPAPIPARVIGRRRHAAVWLRGLFPGLSLYFCLLI